jgi:hypothetical protein
VNAPPSSSSAFRREGTDDPVWSMSSTPPLELLPDRSALFREAWRASRRAGHRGRARRWATSTRSGPYPRRPRQRRRDGRATRPRQQNGCLAVTSVVLQYSCRNPHLPYRFATARRARDRFGVLPSRSLGYHACLHAVVITPYLRYRSPLRQQFIEVHPDLDGPKFAAIHSHSFRSGQSHRAKSAPHVEV